MLQSLWVGQQASGILSRKRCLSGVAPNRSTQPTDVGRLGTLKKQRYTPHIPAQQAKKSIELAKCIVNVPYWGLASSVYRKGSFVPP
jgi:hypothetical protein